MYFLACDLASLDHMLGSPSRLVRSSDAPTDRDLLKNNNNSNTLSGSTVFVELDDNKKKETSAEMFAPRSGEGVLTSLERCLGLLSPQIDDALSHVARLRISRAVTLSSRLYSGREVYI